MPQNIFLANEPQKKRNIFLEDIDPPKKNIFLDDEKDVLGKETFDPAETPEMNVVGKTLDPIIQAGKTGALRILDLVGRPQQAAFGAILDGAEGAKAGWMGEKKYAGTDLLEEAGLVDKEDSLGKSAAGLAVDLVADPLNLLGAGAIRTGYQAGVKGLGTVAEKAAKATPIVGPAVKTVEKFFDPHAHLKNIDGLKDFARLKESEARSIVSGVHEEVADTFAQKKFGPFIRTVDEPVRIKIAQAIDSGNLNSLSPDELALANKFKSALDTQWNAEVATGHQAAARGPKAQAAPKITDYVPIIAKVDNGKNVSVIHDVRGTTRHSQPRKYPTMADAKAAGLDVVEDSADLLRRRLQSGRLAQHGTRVLDEAINKFGTPFPHPGLRKLNIPSEVNVPHSRKGIIDTHYVPNEVADYLERAHVLYNKPDEVTNTWKNAVKIYKSWLVTTPQQAATNLLGNTINAWMTGNVPKVKNMLESVKIVNAQAVPRTIGRYNGNQILEAMKRYEIIGGQGQYQDIFSKGSNFSLNPLSANNVAGRYSQYFNQHVVEEPFKVAQYLQSLEDGLDLEQAALKVKNTFFDYAELSEPAKHLRDYGIAPFITWQIKNIPLQLENLALRPQKFAQTESIYDAIDDDEAVVPHQDQREGIIPISETEGVRVANPILDLNKLPIGDYEGKDFLLDTIGGAVPPIKALVELSQNKKIYNDQPIFRENDDAIPMDTISTIADKLGLDAAVGIGEDEMGQTRQNELMAYILQQNPWQYYGRNFLEAPQELVEKGSIASAPNIGESEWFANMMGFRNKTYNPKQQEKEFKRRLQNIMEQ